MESYWYNFISSQRQFCSTEVVGRYSSYFCSALTAASPSTNADASCSLSPYVAKPTASPKTELPDMYTTRCSVRMNMRLGVEL